MVHRQKDKCSQKQTWTCTCKSPRMLSDFPLNAISRGLARRSIYSAYNHVTFWLLLCHLPPSQWELSAQVIPVEYPNYYHLLMQLDSFRSAGKGTICLPREIISCVSRICLSIRISHPSNQYCILQKLAVSLISASSSLVSCSPTAFVIF